MTPCIAGTSFNTYKYGTDDMGKENLYLAPFADDPSAWANALSLFPVHPAYLFGFFSKKYTIFFSCEKGLFE
jgi:hypothetical protein